MRAARALAPAQVELTPEGARLLREARRVLGQLERAVLEVRGMAAGESGRLRIGFVSLADYGVLPGLLKSFKSARPGVALALREMLSPEQARRSPRASSISACCCRRCRGRASSTWSCSASASSPRCRRAIASRAPRGRLAMSELAGEAFVMVPRDIAPGLYDIVTGLAARAGFSLNVAQEAIQMQTVVSLVSSGLGVAIVPARSPTSAGAAWSTASSPTAHPRLDLWLAWRRGALGAAARDFLAPARTRRRASRDARPSRHRPDRVLRSARSRCAGTA